MQREKYEWTQLWWEDADDFDSDRILMIGDSISVGYRPLVQQHFDSRYKVDLWASSKSTDDPAFFKELEYVLSQYKYKLIHFNNGLHGLHTTEAEYRENFEKAVDKITAVCPNVIIALSTPITENGHTDRPHAEKNPVVIMKNNIAREIAEQKGLTVNDLYAHMYLKSEIRSEDGYHYNDDGRKLQSDIICELIENVLK